MAICPERKVVLAWTTATVGSNKKCKHISEQRAKAVKELSVSENKRIAVLVLRYNHKYHILEIRPNGVLNAYVPVNRPVIIMNADDQSVSELLAI